MRVPLNVLVLLLAFGLSACVSKHKQIELGAGSRPSLSKSGSVYITTPENGWYGSNVYPNSAVHTVSAFRTAFIRHTDTVYIESDVRGFEENLQRAKEKGFDYLVQPLILHWEERATEWSGKPDRIEVQVRIADVATGKELDKILLMASSKWATMGGDHPEDLLPEPINEYVDSLYA